MESVEGKKRDFNGRIDYNYVYLAIKFVYEKKIMRNKRNEDYQMVEKFFYLEILDFHF